MNKTIMKILIKIFIFTFFLLNVIPEAKADVIYLKNGREIEGIITKETDEYIELAVGFGSVTFYRREIKRIRHSPEKEKQRIEQAWEEERLRQEAELEKRQEEKRARPEEIEISRQGSHLFVNALLNGRVNAKMLIDTGASIVVLSPKVAKELNIDVKNAAPDIKMVLADGREASAKLIKLDVISIEEATARDIDAVVIYKDDAFPGFDGVLGMSFLKLFKFEINIEQNKLILQKL